MVKKVLEKVREYEALIPLNIKEDCSKIIIKQI